MPLRKTNASFWIYLVGVAALGGFLGAFEASVRHAVGNGVSFALVLIYLVLLRVAGRYLDRRASRSM